MAGTEEEFQDFVAKNRDLIEKIMVLQKEGVIEVASAGRDAAHEAAHVVDDARVRAGAKEQLSVRADRLNTEIIVGKENEDPASVAYKGVKYGKENNYDLIIVDTAGRLQNKTNLMEELKKIKRVIGKEILTPIDCYLILDATTGQNGVLQAKAFKDLIDVNGIVITKMDGTSKGGIILAIKEELNIPVKFIGLGEKMEDLEVFDLNKYLYGLCKELIEDDE